VKTLSFTLVRGNEQASLNLPINRMVNAGFAARDQELVNKHIQELRKEGVPAPEETPTLYPVSPYMITQEDTICALDGRTSGEAEFVLVINDDKVYVAVGSDHTDRDLEIVSISKSKQIYPNIISKEVWLLSDIEELWDSLVLRSWVVAGNDRTLYQEEKLSALLAPDALLNLVKTRLKDSALDGLAIYSGTISALSGELVFGQGFEAELLNPLNQMRLTCNYKIGVMEYLR